jgi:hypothetical protein
MRVVYQSSHVSILSFTQLCCWNDGKLKVLTAFRETKVHLKYHSLWNLTSTVTISFIWIIFNVLFLFRQTRVKYENDFVIHRLNISYFSYQAIVIKKNSDDIRIMHPSFTSSINNYQKFHMNSSVRHANKNSTLKMKLSSTFWNIGLCGTDYRWVVLL